MPSRLPKGSQALFNISETHSRLLTQAVCRPEGVPEKAGVDVAKVAVSFYDVGLTDWLATRVMRKQTAGKCPIVGRKVPYGG